MMSSIIVVPAPEPTYCSGPGCGHTNGWLFFWVLYWTLSLLLGWFGWMNEDDEHNYDETHSNRERAQRLFQWTVFFPITAVRAFLVWVRKPGPQK